MIQTKQGYLSAIHTDLAKGLVPPGEINIFNMYGLIKTDAVGTCLNIG